MGVIADFSIMQAPFLLVFSLLLVPSVIGVASKGGGSCPIQETIKTCYPRCLSDYECMGYKKCCPNVCGSMSCSDLSPVPSGNDPRNGRAEGVMCGNVMCLPKQKCISENSLKRPKCSW